MVLTHPPGGVAPGESEEDMFREMDKLSLMGFEVDTVYGLHNPQTQEVILVSDLRRFDHGEYRVEKGNCFGVKPVWSNLSKQKCIQKATQMAQAAG